MAVAGPPFYDENEWEPDELPVVVIHGNFASGLNNLFYEAFNQRYGANLAWAPAPPSSSYTVFDGHDGKQYLTDVNGVTYVNENGVWIRQ